MSPYEPADGTVSVAVALDHPPVAAWRALTGKGGLSMWFGTADSPLEAEAETRIDFEDGDFFLVNPSRVEPESVIEFDWRFLGTGPPSHVRWEVRETPAGCAVTVTDRGWERDAETVQELTAGWTDFLSRLRGHLDTGENTRYDWRGEIDGAVDLPVSGWRLLEDERLPDWLPIATDGFRLRWIFVIDGEGPRRFEMTQWRHDRDDIRFSVVIPDADKPTSCLVRVRSIAGGTRLSFSHTGWRGLGLTDEVARRLRAHFAATWVWSLRRATEVAGGMNVR